MPTINILKFYLFRILKVLALTDFYFFYVRGFHSKREKLGHAKNHQIKLNFSTEKSKKLQINRVTWSTWSSSERRMIATRLSNTADLVYCTCFVTCFLPLRSDFPDFSQQSLYILTQISYFIKWSKLSLSMQIITY